MPNGSVTIVQESRANDAVAVTSQTYTLATDFAAALAPTTPGTTLLIYVTCITRTRVLSSITDSGGNVWKVIGGVGSASGSSLFMAVLPAADHKTSITTVTVTLDGNSRTQIALREVRGITGKISNNGTAFQFDDHTTAATTAASTTTMAADGGAPKWVAAACAALTAPTSVNSPFTTDATPSGGGAGQQQYIADSSLQPGAGSITATFNMASEISTTGLVAFDVFQGVEIPYEGDFPLDNRQAADGPWAGPARLFYEDRTVVATPTVDYADAATATISFTASAPANTGLTLPFQAIIDQQIIAGTNATPIVLTVPSGMLIPVGDTIVVYASSASQYYTIADSHTQTWTTDASVGAGGGGAATALRAFRTTVSTQFVGGDTITLTPTTTVAGKVAAALWLKDVSSLDTAADNTMFDNTATPTSFTETSPTPLAQPHAFVVNAYAVSGAKSPTVDTGWTRTLSIAHPSGTIITLVVDVQEFKSGGTPSEAVTWTGAAAYSSVLMPYAMPNVVAGEAAQFVDADTGNLSLVASAVETHGLPDEAATATLNLVASGTDTAQFVEAATATLTLTVPFTSVSDNANRANTGPPPSANWQTDPEAYGAAGFTVTSNQFAPISATDNEMAWIPDTFGPNIDMSFDMPVVPPSGQQVDLEILTNWSVVAQTGYDLQWSGTTHVLTLYRADAGAYTSIGTATQVLSDGDAIRILINGATVEGWLRVSGVWIRQIQVSDSTYRQAGIKVGVYTSGNTTRLDNFQAASFPDTAQFVDASTATLSLVASGTETSQFVDAATAQLTLVVPFTSVSDDANRADTGPPPSANWQTDPEAIGAGGFSIVSNIFTPTNAVRNEMAWIPDVFGPYVDMAFDVPTLPAASSALDLEILTAGTWALGTYNGYLAHYVQGGGFSIYRYDAGAPTLLTSNSQALTAGDRYRFIVTPVAVEIWIRSGGVWSLVLSVADTTWRIPNFEVGIYTTGNAVRLDNFTATNFLDAAQLVDSDTAFITFTASGVETPPATGTDIPCGGVFSRQSMPGPNRGPQGLFMENHDSPAAPAVAYTDAATANLTLVAGGTETADFVDAATGQLTLVTSASETAQFVDSTTCTLSLVASATEVAVFVDSFTCTLSMVASGTDVPVYADADTAFLSNVASDTQLFAAVDQDTAFLAMVAGGGELLPAPYDIPNGGVYPRNTMAGPFRGPVGFFHEERPTLPIDYVEPTVFETVPFTMVASGTELHEIFDADTAFLTLSATGTDTEQFVEAATAQLILDCSGSLESKQGLTTDAATATLSLVASATEQHLVTTIFVDDEFNRTVSGGLGTASPTGGAYTLTVSASKYSVNGSRARIISDSTTERAAIQATNEDDTDNIITCAFDALPVSHQFKMGLYARRTGPTSAINQYSARIQLDVSGNIILRIDKTVANTTINLVPAATILTGYTAGTDIKLRFLLQGTSLSAKVWYASGSEPGSWTQSATDTDFTVGDNGFYGSANTTLEGTTIGFESYIVQGPAVATETTYFDSGTAALSLVASATEVRAAVDSATVPLSLIAGGTEAIGDFGTALLIMDASLSDEQLYVDSHLVTFEMKASAQEGFSYPDAATAFLNTAASATFVHLYNDTAVALLHTFSFNLIPTAVFTDASIARLFLLAVDFTETQPKYDYYLATTLTMRWSTVGVGFRLTTVARGRFTTDASDRFDTNGVGFDPRG